MQKIDKLNRKIITVSYVCFCAVVGWCLQVILEMTASLWGAFTRFYDQEIVRHGVPVFAGLALFFFLQFHPRVLKWADEVVVEVRKVIWPSKKDTTAMSVVVCVILVVSGILLGLLDFFSRSMVNLVMSL